MRIGVVFPQTEIGADPGAVRAYAQHADGLGYTHLLAYDHVLGADPEVHPGWSGPYDLHTTFHEPFVLFGYLAAVTSLELVTGIIILPQRQTALVAKQAAEVDLLTGGRFRLGVGLGWNAVEYEALGQDFGRRGAPDDRAGRPAPPAVDGDLGHSRGPVRPGHRGRAGAACRCSGRSRCGSAPSPRARTADRGAGRRLVPAGPARARPGRGQAQVDDAARAAGRDPASLGMEGRVSWRPGNAERLAARARGWQDAGATHLSVNTMGAGLTSATVISKRCRRWPPRFSSTWLPLNRDAWPTGLLRG